MKFTDIYSKCENNDVIELITGYHGNIERGSQLCVCVGKQRGRGAVLVRQAFLSRSSTY